MALFATLELGDNDTKIYTRTYPLVDCSFHFSRKYNHAQPETNARCQSIDCTLITPDKSDLNLFVWYINQEEYNGRIIIVSASSNANELVETREILFENALCYRISEDFSVHSPDRRTLKLYLAAEDVTICNLIY